MRRKYDEPTRRHFFPYSKREIGWLGAFFLVSQHGDGSCTDVASAVCLFPITRHFDNRYCPRSIRLHSVPAHKLHCAFSFSVDFVFLFWRQHFLARRSRRTFNISQSRWAFIAVKNKRVDDVRVIENCLSRDYHYRVNQLPCTPSARLISNCPSINYPRHDEPSNN